MPDQFVTLGQAAARLGVSRPAIRRRVAAGELTPYRNPRDAREQLFRLDDLERYATPRPIAPRDGKGARSPDHA